LFSDTGFCFLDSFRAEGKTQVSRAALAASKRPQEEWKQKRPLQHAPPMGAQDIVASAKRASPWAHLERNCVRLWHETPVGYLEMILRLASFARERRESRFASALGMGYPVRNFWISDLR
jgi:hypothetical protein